MNLINIQTGETFNEDADDAQVAEAYKQVQIEIKRLEQISDDLKNNILDRLKPDQRTFGDFFNIIHQNRRYLDPKNLPTIQRKNFDEAREFIRKLEEEFGELKSSVQIRFPKY